VTETNGNGNNKILWWIIGLLTLIIVGMVGTYLTLIRNIVTQDDLARQLSPINEKAEKLLKAAEVQRDDTHSLQVDVAVIKEKLPKTKP
jgi:hypothetical protein